ncbi:MAG: hypothetical protein AB7G75_08815 [Candidatus Binatia bacterium]
MKHRKGRGMGSILSTFGGVLTAAIIGAGIGIGVPDIAHRLFRRIRWGQIGETEKERYQRWLREHRRKLWGRDFDDGDGSILDRVFEVANRTRSGRVVEDILDCLENEPNDQAALAKMKRIVERA